MHLYNRVVLLTIFLIKTRIEFKSSINNSNEESRRQRIIREMNARILARREEKGKKDSQLDLLMAVARAVVRARSALKEVCVLFAFPPNSTSPAHTCPDLEYCAHTLHAHAYTDALRLCHGNHTCPRLVRAASLKPVSEIHTDSDWYISAERESARPLSFRYFFHPLSLRADPTATWSRAVTRTFYA